MENSQHGRFKSLKIYKKYRIIYLFNKSLVICCYLRQARQWNGKISKIECFEISKFFVLSNEQHIWVKYVVSNVKVSRIADIMLY